MQKIDTHHGMVDLETMGVNPKSVIVSIGVAAFDKTGIKATFYVPVNIHSCVKYGLVMDSSTVEWWIKQASKNDGSSKVFDENGLDLKDALMQLQAWWATNQVATIWGNGADFDNVILKSAYDAVGLLPPFKPYAGRCFRTLKNIYPKIDVQRVGVHHNALDDAIFQASYAIELMQKHNLS